jgi:hypothetical protein
MQNTYHPSSRLVKKEKQKLQKQTFLYIFIGITVLLFFIFILVPNLIRVFFAIIDKEDPSANLDTVPPQVPVLSSTPLEATSSATLELTGFAESESQVVFVLNSQETAQVKANAEGSFAQVVNLNAGVNELAIFGVDQAGNQSLKTRSYMIEFDDQAPEIELESPQDGSVVELKKNQTITVKGKTEPLAKVYVNDRFVLADQEGLFQSNYYLKEGKNELIIKAIDKALNQTELKVEVEFRL